MKIQPVTTKVQTAYPMLAKAAAITAIAAASLVSASGATEPQRTAGIPVAPPSQNGKNDTAPNPEEEEQRTSGEAPEEKVPPVQNPGGSVIIEIDEQEDGGDVEDDEFFGWGED